MVKRGFDIVLALIGLVLVSPLLAVCAVLVRLDSSGPALFTQRRVGRHFQPFEIYKFRTMRQETDGRRAITVDGEAPITRVGRWLRQSKLDELPQLYNVLRGDMSFVGPRPEVPRYVELFRREYQTILRVRPGLTDPAAVKYRDESAILSRSFNPEEEYVRRILPDKLRLSAEYVRHASLLGDMALIGQTVLVLLRGPVRAAARGVLFALAFVATVMVTRPAGEGADAPGVPTSDPREWYAAPQGKRDAKGHADDPLDLGTALAKRGPVEPGDTLWLKPGRYHGSFTSTIAGTATHPIIVRGSSAWTTTIDAEGATTSPLIIRGAWTVFRDIEITNSNPDRSTTVTGSRAADAVRRDGVVVYGTHTKLVNLIVHGNGDGIALWGPARNTEVYGCIVFRNGWVGPDRGHGHGLYIQNRADTKFVNDVVSFENYATGMKAYAESGEVDGVEFDGVISFDNGAPAASDGHARMPNIFVGSATVPASRASIVNSYLYHSSVAQPDLGGNLALGFTARGNGEAIVRSTYVVGGHRALFVREWTKLAVDSSTFIVTGAGEGERARLVSLEQTRRAESPQLWDGNRYISSQDQEFIVDGRRVDFERWRQITGFDEASSFAPKLPETAEVFVRPNRHEVGRAHVAVFNWPRQAAVSVDISGLGLNVGDAFEVRDVKNLFGQPLVAGHLEEMTVRVPLLPESSPPEFAVFLVRRASGDGRTP